MEKKPATGEGAEVQGKFPTWWQFNLSKAQDSGNLQAGQKQLVPSYTAALWQLLFIAAHSEVSLTYSHRY